MIKVQRKPVIGEAVQFVPGISHPSITIDSAGKATANNNCMSCMSEVLYVYPGDWVVREPGQKLDQVFNDDEFHKNFLLVE